MRLLALLTLVVASCAARPRPETPASNWASSVSETDPPAVTPESAKAGDGDDPYLAVPNILDALNRARAELGIGPIRLDRALCAVAQQGTAVFFQYGGRGAEQRTASVLGVELERFRHVYAEVRTAVLPSEALSTVTALQPAMDAEMTYVGIAVEEQRAEKAVVLIFAR